MGKLTKIPDIPTPIIAPYLSTIEAIREIEEVRNKRRGDPLDAFMSFRDFYDYLETDEKTVDLIIAAANSSGTLDHGSLGGKTDPDHPATAVTVNTGAFGGILDGGDSLVQTALDTLDDHLHTAQTLLNNGITPDSGTLTITGAALVGGVSNNLDIADNGTISFNGTARIGWTKITANGVTLGDGPPTSGDTVSDLQTAHDGNTYEVAEIAANAGQNLIVDFTSVTAFNWVQILARVAETAGHALTVQLEITPFNDTAWHTYHVMKNQAADQNFENYSFLVPDDAAYINSGVVKVRFIHEMAGDANDDWFFDVVALYQ